MPFGTEGTHLLIDLYGVAIPKDIIGLLMKMADVAGANVLSTSEHVFDGGGRTAVLLLSLSHASIHTWPEHKYISIDFYSCRILSQKEVQDIFHLALSLKPSSNYTREIRRGKWPLIKLDRDRPRR